MNKQEFLTRLRKGLSSLPQEEIEERQTFYDEMIDDRMEEGLSEEEAVRSIGPVDSIVGQIILEPSQGAQPQKRRFKTWEIVLLLLSAPIWVPLLGGVLSVVLSVGAALLSAAIVLWVVPISLVCSAFGLVLASLVQSFSSDAIAGLATLSAGLVCAGLSIFAIWGAHALTKGVVQLGKQLISWTKQRFAKKEAAQ